MRIALCSKGNFSLEKGFTKNRIELAESLEKLGWETLLVDNQIIGLPATEKLNPTKYNHALRDYLIKNSSQFDVVLYEYDTLPFDRSLFDSRTLFVARPAILAFYFPLVKFRYNFKARLSHLLDFITKRSKATLVNSKTYQNLIEYSLSQSDVIQVQNTKDRDLLVGLGFSAQKIIIIPNGITAERIAKFGISSQKSDETFKIAFVGTFDFRKGAMDFPIFFKEIKKRFPTIKLKLLGAKGIFSTQDQILSIFPKKHRSSIEVVPQFKSEELPQLLADCNVGVFPSYLESFGFGALEMMCAGLPVAAYDCPGPCDFILPDLLAPVGDPVALSAKVAELLENKEVLTQKSKEARARVVTDYCWDDIAVKVDIAYKSHLKKIRKAVVPERLEYS